MNLKETFDVQYKDWTSDKPGELNTAFQWMATTVEDSPWHREANVLVHTNMVLDKYSSYIPNAWTHVDYLGALACAFHDVAKPPCEIVKHNVERGTYRAYHGHELMSARMFENFVMSGCITNVSPEDVFKTSWMIEHHLPWDLKDKTKRAAFAQTVKRIGVDTFLNVLRADQYGRISDDEHAKKMRVESWVTNFLDLCGHTYVPQMNNHSIFKERYPSSLSYK